MDPIGTKVLEDLRDSSPIFEKAVIAGGFVRDRILGGAFKDVDVFIPVNDKSREFISSPKLRSVYGDLSRMKTADLLIEHLFESKLFDMEREGGEPLFRYKNTVYDAYPSGETGLKIEMTTDVSYFGKIPVQLVFFQYQSDPYKELMDSFDFNINKVYTDGNEDIVSKEANHDLTTYRATLSRADSIEKYMKSVERFTRWKVKYPTLTMINKVKFFTQKEVLEREKVLIENQRRELESLRNELAAYRGGKSEGGGGDLKTDPDLLLDLYTKARSNIPARPYSGFGQSITDWNTTASVFGGDL